MARTKRAARTTIAATTTKEPAKRLKTTDATESKSEPEPAKTVVPMEEAPASDASAITGTPL